MFMKGECSLIFSCRPQLRRLQSTAPIYFTGDVSVGAVVTPSGSWSADSLLRRQIPQQAVQNCESNHSLYEHGES